MSAPTPGFAVVTDGGLDAYAGLRNDVPVAPFSVNFGNVSFKTHEISREDLYRQLQTNPEHPTSSQPTPQDWSAAVQQTSAVFPYMASAHDRIAGWRTPCPSPESVAA